MTGEGAVSRPHVQTIRSKSPWDSGTAHQFATNRVGYTNTYPNINHPETDYQLQYIYHWLNLGDVKDAEDGTITQKLYFIFRKSDGTNIIYASIEFSNDVANEEIDIVIRTYSYYQTTSGTPETFSVPNTVQVLFLQFELAYGDAVTDYLTLNTRVSTVPLFPTGTPNAFHTAQSTGVGSLKCERLLIQNYLYDTDPGSRIYLSTPLINAVDAAASEIDLEVTYFPHDLTGYDTYWYGDDVEQGKALIGPYRNLPYDSFEHQTVDNIMLIRDDLGELDDAADVDGGFIAKIKAIINLILDIFDGDGIDWSGNISNIFGSNFVSSVADIVTILTHGGIRGLIESIFDNLGDSEDHRARGINVFQWVFDTVIEPYLIEHEGELPAKDAFYEE